MCNRERGAWGVMERSIANLIFLASINRLILIHGVWVHKSLNVCIISEKGYYSYFEAKSLYYVKRHMHYASKLKVFGWCLS